MKFKKETLRDIVYEDCPDGYKLDEFNKVCDDVVDTSRWSIHHVMIFSYKNKFYRSFYSVGATEQQCEEPFEWSGAEIECEEVHQVEKMVKVWEEINV